MTEYDRRKVDDDENKRILDLSSFSFEPPEEGIYDGTVRWYKANIKWAKIIDGLVSWLATTAVWPEAEDENYFAIQQILIFLQGVEPMAMDYEQLKTAIEAAIYDATNGIAAQIVSGRRTNISVDDEGNVSDPTDATGGEEIPEDDPATPDFNEALASEYGGAVSVARALETVFDRVDTLYGTTNGAPTTSEADAQSIMKAYFQTDPALMDTAVTNYYSWRATNSRILFNTSQSFEGYMFCNGYNEQAFNRWLIDESGYNEQKRVIVAGLVTGLADEFFSQAFAKGVKAPSTAYYAAPCTKVNDETIQLDMSLGENVSRTTIETWKANHRFLIKATGTFHDTDAPDWYGDAMYNYNIVTGQKVFNNIGFNSSGGVPNPTQAQVPYNPNHVYEFTVDRNSAADNICIIDKNNGSQMAVPNVSGIITITIKDLGDITP